MGALLSRIFDSFTKESNILMLGLDGAGKTTVLYKMKLGETTSTIPTIGFNVEELQYKNLHMKVWDVGGQTKIRRLWRHYYQNTNALVYVVDANDADRLEEAREELHVIMGDDLMSRVPVLVFANKSDLPHAASPSHLVNGLGLHQLRTEWHVQACSAISGDGLYEGFDWLARNIKTR